MEKKKYKISKSRQINTYLELWRVSHWTMHQAEKEVEGQYFQLMASLIYTAFTLEAYLNHLGKKIFNCWDELERRASPKKKLDVIADKLGIKKDDSQRPYETIKKLFDFRNDVAHGKTILLKTEEEIMIIDSELDDYMHKPLEAEWEQYCTLDNAQRAREDVERIMLELHGASNLGDKGLFFPNMWFSQATLVKDKQ